MLTEAEMETRKQDLSVRRTALRERLNAIKKDYAQGLDSDWEEQALQLENAEVLQEISRVTAEELSKVENGIERLERAIEQVHGKL
jgi:RNA polymerase-binding transcription factor DksA